MAAMTGGLALRWLRALLFTVLVPGTVTAWLPSAILGRRFAVPPMPWGMDEWAALIVIGLGVCVYGWCLWAFVVTGRGIPAPIDHPTRLVVRGLYRHVRNPMYFGVLLVLLGESALFATPVLLAYTAAWLLLVHVAILVYEEPNLRRKFGDEYARYVQEVPRWVPRLSRRV